MHFEFNVPDLSGEIQTFKLPSGSSCFFVGANGSGKTRLAAQAEVQLGLRAHRISAHRALALDPAVPKINEETALRGLRYGFPQARENNALALRTAQRWGNKRETALLNDFDYLMQVLFADQSNIALQTHMAAHAGSDGDLVFTKFQRLCTIWDRLLPHRRLQISGDDIQVVLEGAAPYSASDMSDGERAVFYMLGQVLVAEPNSVLVFDEPELHVHRSILGRLWDEVEATRPDCAFVVITHDLEFAASRPGDKYVIRSYTAPGAWDIERVPEDTGFDEETTTLILGSRKPILFVEGTSASLDLAIYRACYPNWTVLPRGSSEEVIHAVATMRNNAPLTRITCAGIVDADDYTDGEKSRLADLGVATLPVSEIENIFLLPRVAESILLEERYNDDEIKARLSKLQDAIIEEVKRPEAVMDVVLRYCRRRIDRTLKKVDLSGAISPDALSCIYRDKTGSVDVLALSDDISTRINVSVDRSDIPALLADFDNKALLALAARHLRGDTRTAFESWLTRVMRDPEAVKLKAALAEILPEVTAR